MSVIMPDPQKHSGCPLWTVYGPRDCGNCAMLAKCELGQAINSDAISITDRMLDHNWTPTMKEIEAMTTEQLKELNAAYDIKNERDAIKEMNSKSQLTAGTWDSEKKEWTNKSATNPTGDGAAETPHFDSGLTAGYFDGKKHRWRK